MSTDRLERLMEAKKYQKKAIEALFPEQMQGHMQVIENEMKAMVRDGMMEILTSEQGMEFIRTMMQSQQSADKSEFFKNRDEQKTSDEAEDCVKQKDATTKSSGKTGKKVKNVTIS